MNNEQEEREKERKIPMSYPSLCIPRVANHFDADKIRRVFEDVNLGRIGKIDIVERRNPSNGEVYKRVFIHFYKWFHNERAQNARNRLMEGKDIKIVCENPWFWRVSANKWQHPSLRKVQGERGFAEPNSSSTF